MLNKISKLLKKLIQYPFVQYAFRKLRRHLPARVIHRLRQLYFTKETDYSFFVISKPSTKKHNILFIHPRIAIQNRLHKKIYPMGYLYISAYLKKHYDDLNIELLNMQALDLPLDIAKAKIEEKRWDAICFSYFTSQADDAYSLSAFARKNQDAPIIHGGVHPTLLPEEALEHADLVVCHEGEETMLELMGRLRAGRDYRDLKGLAFHHDGKVRKTAPRPFIEDLDTIPFPDWELLDYLERYDTPMHIIGGPRMPLFGSRGCPYNCTFCTSPLFWKRRLRWRRPELVALEMKTIKDRYGFKSIHFWDDNMMMRAGWLEKLCREMLRLELDMAWVGLTKASHLVKNRHLLPLMKQAGCIGIEIGLESFSDEVAERVDKGEDTHTMFKATEHMEEAGLTPLYTHMLFNPGETLDSYYRKHQFLQKMGMRLFNSDAELGQLATPHRTTVFEEEAPKAGRVFSRENRHYIHHRINFLPNSFLEDVPRLKARHSRLYIRRKAEDFLYGVVLMHIMDWTESDSRLFLKVAGQFGSLADGQRNIARISDTLESRYQLDSEKAAILTSLAAVFHAREGWITSSQGDFAGSAQRP